MRPRHAAPALLLAVCLLAGCFRTNTVIFLNEDGSGTIEETVLVASFVLNMIQEMDSTQAVNLVDEDKLNARADSLGEGVVFEGAEVIGEDGYQGYIATYSFTDINLVHLNENEDALALGDEQEVPDDEQEAPDEEDPPGLSGLGMHDVTFSFHPGELGIHIPHPAGGETEIHPDSLAAETEKIRSQMQEQGGMMRAFLADARVSVSIVLPSAITETNASFPDSNAVTLVDIVFGTMLDLMQENPELAARMQLAQSETHRQALMSEMAPSDDFRFETNSDIVVRFK